MITVDSWLLDLADMGPEYRKVAYTLALMQHGISRDIGHLVALNDNYARGKIKTAARRGAIADVNIRCLRCGAVASAKHWIFIAQLDEHDRQRIFHRYAPSAREQVGMCLKPCEGDVKALQKLEALAGEGGQIP